MILAISSPFATLSPALIFQLVIIPSFIAIPNFGIEAPADGTVLDIAVSEDEGVPPGTVICYIGKPNEKVFSELILAISSPFATLSPALIFQLVIIPSFIAIPWYGT
jgi:hypothetical protein